MEKKRIISKYSYSFVIEHRKNKYVENIELIFENYSNEKIIITLYQFIDQSIATYYNVFSVDYFTNQSPIIKCILFMSKNQNKYIEKLLDILKKPLDYDKRNNLNNLIFNEKNICFRIKNNKNALDDNYDSINLNIYITLINLQKEKITLNLNKVNFFNLYHNIDENIKIPNSIIDLMEQNNNMIQDISTMEKELRNLTSQKNELRDVIKRCNDYYGQNIKMKMDLMDQGIDTDILKSKQDLIFLEDNISKRLNKEIKQIKQIYKASSNGDNLSALHATCIDNLDNPNILILILTDEKKIFGGFTQTKFEINRYKYDPLAFLFSLDNKEIYPILSNYEKMAINCYEDKYPLIFGSDIYLGDYFFLNEKSIAQEGYYDYTKSKIKGDYILNGKKYFSVAELEIYQFDFFE